MRVRDKRSMLNFLELVFVSVMSNRSLFVSTHRLTLVTQFIAETIIPHTNSLFSINKMKFTSAAALFAVAVAPTVSAFAPPSFGRPTTTSATALNAEIRPKTDKSKELKFGWDGTTALGGAVENAAPARMLEDIRAAGETIPDACEIFNANVEMDANDLMFEDVIEMIDTHYESQLLEFKNGDILNKQGENEGSAKLLSYAALSNMDKDTTLKVDIRNTGL